MFKMWIAVGMTAFLFCSVANAQKGEVTLTLNEAFFDAVLDSIFQNLGQIEFPISSVERKVAGPEGLGIEGAAFSGERRECRETVRILRESGNLRSAIRLVGGKVTAKLVFAAKYDPPFLGCLDVSGVADAVIDLYFDADAGRIAGRARVQSVNLNGSGGIGGGVFARLVQSSIDKKINPIEIIRLDKLSFLVPIPNTGNLRMKAVSARPEVLGNQLNIHVAFHFSKE
ncbi:MAG: hypothetical protein WKF34_12120 [Pyrinomonadaceae bacterium]